MSFFALAWFFFWSLLSLGQSFPFPGPGRQAQGGSAGTWTFLHVAENTGCNGTSCTVTVPSTTAGSVQVVWAVGGGSSNTISSASGGGGSWTLCPSSGCHTYSSSGGGNLDGIYNVTGTGGATSIQVNISPSETWTVVYAEASCSGCSGSRALDTYGVTAGNSSCGSCTGVGLGTLTGNPDFGIQMLNYDNSLTIPSPWTLESTDQWYLYATNLTSSNDSAPSITQSPNGVFIASAMAFK